MAVENWRAVLNGKLARKCTGGAHSAFAWCLLVDVRACLRVSYERKGCIQGIEELQGLKIKEV